MNVQPESSWQYVLCHLNFTCSLASVIKRRCWERRSRPNTLELVQMLLQTRRFHTFVSIDFLLPIYVYIYW